jgi:hypothetical protein
MMKSCAGRLRRKGKAHRRLSVCNTRGKLDDVCLSATQGESLLSRCRITAGEGQSTVPGRQTDRRTDERKDFQKKVLHHALCFLVASVPTPIDRRTPIQRAHMVVNFIGQAPPSTSRQPRLKTGGAESAPRHRTLDSPWCHSEGRATGDAATPRHGPR